MKLIFILLFPIIANAPHVYKGTIVNNPSKMYLPFATVGVLQENIGTNADEQEQFELQSTDNPIDTLVI